MHQHSPAHDSLALVIPLVLVVVPAVVACVVKSRAIRQETGESDATTLAGMLGALLLGVVVAYLVTRGHGSAVCSMALVPGMIVHTRAGGTSYRFERMTTGGMADLRAIDGVNTLTWAPDDLIVSAYPQDRPCTVDLGPIREYAREFLVRWGGEDPEDVATWADEDLTRAVSAYVGSPGYHSLGTLYADHLHEEAMAADEVVAGPSLPDHGSTGFRTYVRLCSCGAVETRWPHEWHDSTCGRCGTPSPRRPSTDPSLLNRIDRFCDRELFAAVGSTVIRERLYVEFPGVDRSVLCERLVVAMIASRSGDDD